MSDIRRIVSVLALFEGARTRKEYNAAKRAASRLDPLHQFAIVDAAIDARHRIEVSQ
jgi:hypothetical protein